MLGFIKQEEAGSWLFSSKSGGIKNLECVIFPSLYLLLQICIHLRSPIWLFAKGWVGIACLPKSGSIWPWSRSWLEQPKPKVKQGEGMRSRKQNLGWGWRKRRVTIKPIHSTALGLHSPGPSPHPQAARSLQRLSVHPSLPPWWLDFEPQITNVCRLFMGDICIRVSIPPQRDIHHAESGVSGAIVIRDPAGEWRGLWAHSSGCCPLP